MGVIVLAVAILPMLGIGGMQLYKAETPGPMKESKLTPRIAETAKALWYVYLAVTILCAVAYWWAGMGWFDAICHSFTTVATGGFSTHDASMAYFDSRSIDYIAACFMLLSGANFALLYATWRRRSPFLMFFDPEFRFYFGLMFVYVVLVAVGLWVFQVDDNFVDVMRHAFFQVASFATGTGLTSADPASWPSYLPYLLVFISFIGACAGSTGGGMKVVRAALVFEHSLRELRQLIYPHGVFALRFGRRAVSDSVLQAVWGFVGVYITLAVILTLVLTATGLDLGTAVSTVAASLNNLGVGIGGVAEGFSELTDTAKWIMTAAMLLGRLEVFTVLVLFTRMFWRQ
jgi:trk system potassium uptake protein TrkH